MHFPTFDDLDMVLVSSEVSALISGILYYQAAQAEGDTVPLSESLWSAWTFISDPGTHAEEVYISSIMLCQIGSLWNTIYSIISEYCSTTTVSAFIIYF